MARAFPSAVIENLRPLVDGGRYPVKRIVGDDLAVEADIFKDGHDVVAAALKWRAVGEKRWHETPMSFVDNDRWRGVCTLYEIGVHEYTVEAWTDSFRSWRDEFRKKFEAGITNLSTEALEGAKLVEEASDRAQVAEDALRLRELSECIRTADFAQINNMVHSGELDLMKLLRAMSTRPAELLGLPGGSLRSGAAADLIVIDPDLPWVLDPAELKSKCKNTPFDEARMTGRVVRTIVAGRTVYELV